MNHLIIIFSIPGHLPLQECSSGPVGPAPNNSRLQVKNSEGSKFSSVSTLGDLSVLAWFSAKSTLLQLEMGFNLTSSRSFSSHLSTKTFCFAAKGSETALLTFSGTLGNFS